MIVAIDGPAGSGKSTVAEMLSKKLNFIHFNSGALYRAITVHLINEKFDFELITQDFPTSDLALKTYFKDGCQHVEVNNIDVTDSLRNNQVSILTPKVSINRHFRNTIDDCQRTFAKDKNIVLEGRDIGTFVFPNAEVKFYLDCNAHERARRRFEQEKIKNPAVTIEEIEKQILERDEIDKNKKIAPLRVAEDAIIIDSSLLTIDEVVAIMESHIKKKC